MNNNDLLPEGTVMLITPRAVQAAAEGKAPPPDSYAVIKNFKATGKE